MTQAKLWTMWPNDAIATMGMCMNTVVTRHFFFFVYLGPQLWHMEVPRLGVKSESQLLAYTTTTATPDLSHVCNPHHSSWQYCSLTH